MTINGFHHTRRQVLAGGSAALITQAVHAQTVDRIRTVAIFTGGLENHPDSVARIAIIKAGMRAFGWIEDQTVRYVIAYAGNNPERALEIARALPAATPNVVASLGTVPTLALHEAGSTLPVVFVNVTDPVAGGFVASMSRPGGNMTGFTPFEYPVATKWLELLRELSPGLQRIALVGDPRNHNYQGFWARFAPAAQAAGVTSSQMPAGSAADIERTMRSFGATPNSGLVISAAQFSLTHSALIIALCAQLKLPAVYWSRFFADNGGLASYGPNSEALYQQAATYLDRILRGEQPATLPVQEATKFETVINMKAARLIGLSVPTSVLARADDIID